MPAPTPKLSRSGIVMLLVLAALCMRDGANASEHSEKAVEPAAEATASGAASASPAKDPAKEVMRRPNRIESIGPRDPLDMLRERLAQKLGAARNADAANPNVLRVTSKSSAPMITELAEPAASVNARRKAGAITPPRHDDAERARLLSAPASWDYAGDGGPESWGRLKPEFSKCSSGTRQSPIDIHDGFKVELEPVVFDYRPSAFRVIDNGHTVQVNVAAGNAIEVMGKRFELVEFHFHHPSEEHIDGQAFEMVAHLVHKDSEGHLAVVAVLLSRGAAQPVVQSVWNNLPLEKGDELAARLPMNPAELLPAERAYFTYMGSLTTPPCSEGVLWMVMKKPVEVSAEQIALFSRLYPMNARPVQSASGRMIKESN